MKVASLCGQFAHSTPSHLCPERIQAAPPMVGADFWRHFFRKTSYENEP